MRLDRDKLRQTPGDPVAWKLPRLLPEGESASRALPAKAGEGLDHLTAWEPPTLPFQGAKEPGLCEFTPPACSVLPSGVARRTPPQATS